MSKNSYKQRYEQLMQWIPTLKSQRNKRVKSNSNGGRQSLQPRRIKNG